MSGVTNKSLTFKIQKIKGLKIIDPWGVEALVDNFDGEYAWLTYPGLLVPFARSIDELVEAANGQFRTDLGRQFIKRIGAIELQYEPFWVSAGVSSVKQPTPTIESLQRSQPRTALKRSRR